MFHSRDRRTRHSFALPSTENHSKIMMINSFINAMKVKLFLCAYMNQIPIKMVPHITDSYKIRPLYFITLKDYKFVLLKKFCCAVRDRAKHRSVVER